MFYLFLPPADILSPGYLWNGLTIQDLNLGGGMIALREDLTETYTVTGRDVVTFNGQLHDGLQITRTSTEHITGCGYVPSCRKDSQGNLVSDTDTTTHTTTTFVLARGIGVVQIMEIETNNVSDVTYQNIYSLTGFQRLDVEAFKNKWNTYHNAELGFSLEYPALYDEEPYKSICGIRFEGDGFPSYQVIFGEILLTILPYAGPDKITQYSFDFSNTFAPYKCDVDEIGLSANAVYAHATQTLRTTK